MGPLIRPLMVPQYEGTYRRSGQPSCPSWFYDGICQGFDVVDVMQGRPIGKSDFVESPFLDKCKDVSYAPTVMTDYAMYRGLQKFSVDRPTTETELVHELVHYLRECYLPHFDEVEVLNFYTAIAMADITKSPGHHWFFKFTTKGDVLNDADAFDLLYELVRAILMGIPVDCLFSGTLKTELRSLAKVLSQSTRLFQATSFHHQIAATMLFYDQNQFMRSALMEAPSTIGVSMPGKQFTLLFEKLNKFPNGFDADGGSFDACVNLTYALAAREFRKTTIQKEFWPAVDHIYDCVYQGYTYCEGLVVHVPGQKSGWFNTGEDNSLINMCAFFDAWIHLCPGLNIQEHVVYFVNSDDLIFSVSDAAVLQFNITTLHQFLWVRGHNIESPRLEPISPLDLNYLSHHCIMRDIPQLNISVKIAAGNYDKINSAFGYCRSTEPLMLSQRLCGLIFNAWAYRDLWEYWRVEILRWMKLHLQVPKDEPIWALLHRLCHDETLPLQVHLALEGPFFTYRKSLERICNDPALLGDLGVNTLRFITDN